MEGPSRELGDRQLRRPKELPQALRGAPGAGAHLRLHRGHRRGAVEASALDLDTPSPTVIAALYYSLYLYVMSDVWAIVGFNQQRHPSFNHEPQHRSRSAIAGSIAPCHIPVHVRHGPSLSLLLREGL